MKFGKVESVLASPVTAAAPRFLSPGYSPGTTVNRDLTQPRRGRCAQVEAVIGGLFRGHLAAGGQQPAGMRVVGRAVDRFDAEQLAVAVAEYREFALVDRTAQRGVVMARRQPGDLQAQRPLLAPEPWQGGIGVRLAEDPVGDAARVIGGVLHRFEPRHVALRVY